MQRGSHTVISAFYCPSQKCWRDWTNSCISSLGLGRVAHRNNHKQDIWLKSRSRSCRFFYNYPSSTMALWLFTRPVTFSYENPCCSCCALVRRKKEFWTRRQTIRSNVCHEKDASAGSEEDSIFKAPFNIPPMTFCKKRAEGVNIQGSLWKDMCF